jgi:hypothetical protein
MSVASFVLVCAFDLLGRSPDRFPHIVIVDRPAEASTDAVAFVRRGERAIYVVGDSALFRHAMHANRKRLGCRDLETLRLLASTLVHEQWHLDHGPDERGAYYAQMTEVQRIGSGPGRWAYEMIRRAMMHTLEREEARTRVSRQPSTRVAGGSGTGGAAFPWHRPWLGAALESSRLPVVR